MRSACEEVHRELERFFEEHKQDGTRAERFRGHAPGTETEMTLQRTVKAVVWRGERYYVAECVELAVVTQGTTVDDTLANLQEAVALHLEGEDPASFGLAPNPTILVTMELEPARAEA